MNSGWGSTLLLTDLVLTGKSTSPNVQVKKSHTDVCTSFFSFNGIGSPQLKATAGGGKKKFNISLLIAPF